MPSTTDVPELVEEVQNVTETVQADFVLPEYTAYTSLILCSAILAVGLFGNLLVIIVILTNRIMRSSTNLFLLNLSIADLFVLVTSTPTALVEIAIRRDDWILGKVMWLMQYSLYNLLHTMALH